MNGKRIQDKRITDVKKLEKEILGNQDSDCPWSSTIYTRLDESLNNNAEVKISSHMLLYQ